MGFEPTTLRDLVGCFNHWATGDSMVSKGEMWVFDWNRIARSDSQIEIFEVPDKDPHFTLAHHGVSSSSVVRASD